MGPGQGREAGVPQSLGSFRAMPGEVNLLPLSGILGRGGVGMSAAGHKYCNVVSSPGMTGFQNPAQVKPGLAM